MKIAQIKISNILGIESLEFEPSGFTVISGSNGEGVLMATPEFVVAQYTGG